MSTETSNHPPRPGDTRERILDAAIDLFSINGYHGVSIRDIARIVGIKESSIYNHFPGKESLLDEIYTFYQREYAKLMPSEELADRVLHTITPEQFWKNGFRNFKELMEAPRMEKIVRILTMEMYRSERAREIFLANSLRDPVEFNEKIFRKLIERGQIRALDPHSMALQFHLPMFALFVEYLVLHSAGEDTRAIEQQIADHIHFFSELVKKEETE